MDGITFHMEKTMLLPPASAKTDYFRPYALKRALTDLTVLPRKRHEHADSERRQTARGNHVPVVSVQYDVPRTPPSPLMYRFRRLHTPLSNSHNNRPKSEDRIISAPVCSAVLEYPPSVYDRLPEYPLKRSARIDRRLEEKKKRKEQQDQVAVNVESHRLKGLGVGKCYSEYHPPPTAPETVQRQGFAPSTPSLSTSRTSQRTSIMPMSPMGQNQSAAPSRQSSYILPSQKPPSHDRAILKNAQANAIKQITNIYNSRPRTNKDKEIENKVQNPKSTSVHQPTYLHSPMLFSQSHHPGNHEVRTLSSEGQGHSNRVEGQGQPNRAEGPAYSQEDADKVYAAYQNVKTDYGSYLNEYNNFEFELMHIAGTEWRIGEDASKERYRKKLRLLMEATKKVPRDEKDIERMNKMAEMSGFTLRDLLLRKSKSETERSELKLPKLNVVEFSEDRDGNGVQGTSNSNTALLNMNQRLNQMKAQKELTSVQMYSQRMVRLRMTQNQRHKILPWFGSTVVVPQGLGFYRVRCPTYTEGFTPKSIVVPMEQEYLSLSSSSTPTVPYSTADILYGNEVNGSRGQPNEDARQNSFGELEKSRELARSRSKELEQNPNNRRPSSKSGKQRSLTIDSVAPFDKDREDPLRSLSSSLPPAKPSHHFRPNGIRTNIMKPDQLYSTKTNGAAPGRDQDDLVAMGTLWSPNNNSGQPPPVGSSVVSPQQQQQHSSNRINSVSNSNTNSFPSKVVSSSSSVNHSMSSSNNTLNSQRKYPGNNIRPIQVQNNVSGRKNNNSTKEQEDPKYTDPMIGAPASFQQRIIELGALEGDTVRWERSKRLKKKKQDRDS